MDWRKRYSSGGILNLILDIKENEVELASDFRRFYNASIYDIGTEMLWREGIMLVYGLKQNTQSQLFAKTNKWKYPVSSEWLVLADLIDVLIAANTSKGKPKSYPRPFKVGSKNVSGSKVSLQEARKLYKIKRRTEEEEQALAEKKKTKE